IENLLPEEVSEIRLRKRMRRSALVTAYVLFAYFASSLVVFDFSSTAQDRYEGTNNGKQVAYGPRPRGVFAYGCHLDIPGGCDFNGHELVFVVYRPICYVWRKLNGYELPSAWH